MIKLEFWRWECLGFSPSVFMGLEGTRCSNKGSLLPFSPWHKNDIKCTPASCHVNESKSNNAQGATKQPSPLFSAILAFNLCIEIPGTAKSRGCFMYISPHKPSYRNKWFIIFWGGQCAGKEKKRSSNPCSTVARIPWLPNAKAEQNKEICILSDAKQPAVF